MEDTSLRKPHCKEDFCFFLDVPKSTMHAVSDVGAVVEWLQEHIEFGQNFSENLAVLHNQNHMVSMSLD